MSYGPIYGTITGRSGVALLARIRGANGALITQASLSTITYSVINLTTASSVGTGSFTISTTVYDSLQQTDQRWRKDSAAMPGPDGTYGFNFLGILGASLFSASVISGAGVSDPPPRYHVDVIFTPASGEAFRQSWVFGVGRVYG